MEGAIAKLAVAPSGHVTVRFFLEAGALLRGQLRRALPVGAAQMGLDYSAEEYRSLLGSTFHVRVEGEARRVRGFLRALADTLDERC